MAELTINDIIKEENLVYKKTKVMTDNGMHYCPADTELPTALLLKLSKN